MTIDRRTLFRAGAGLGLGAAVTALAPGIAAAGLAGFPTYRYLRTAFDKGALRYNPTNELIFPTIRGTVGRVSGALGRFYLYYAPHDAPGGICLAYGDSLEGPFTEYPANPIVSRDWAPHYSVSHVSSAHVLWNTAAKEMWLYFHGENTTTRLARSKDGIHFTYDKVVLSTSMLPAGTTETSYARVFEHKIASRGANYVMVFMTNTTANKRNIGWGWSADGRTWTFSQTPLIRASEVGATDAAAPSLAYRNGTTYVVFHTNLGTMHLTEVGNDFTKKVHLGVFHTPLSGAPDRGRSAAPSFGTENGVEYMFYEAGARLEGAIAIARAV
ncbi:hypothetical protein [Umezawaea sp. NPDC059074]|uniref:hypothetical protein n=1 Tax=Umezawaea sp. NPDC059074 TaxID=3346716 RepID=UPI00368875CB